MSTSFDGPCTNSNDSGASQARHRKRSTLRNSASPPCSPTGNSSPSPDAGLWEPYDGRLSSTVLGEREGEVPARHSPKVGVAIRPLVPVTCENDPKSLI